MTVGSMVNCMHFQAGKGRPCPLTGSSASTAVVPIGSALDSDITPAPASLTALLAGVLGKWSIHISTLGFAAAKPASSGLTADEWLAGVCG